MLVPVNLNLVAFMAFTSDDIDFRLEVFRRLLRIEQWDNFVSTSLADYLF